MLKKLMESFKRFVSEEELIESRLSDVKKRYPEHHDSIDKIAEYDPSGNYKYLAWMVKRIIKGGEDENNVVKAVEAFHKNAQRLEKKDLNQYRSAEEVLSTIERLGDTQKVKRKRKKEKAVEGSNILYQDDDFLFVRPDTKAASCYYGQGTTWCVSREKRDEFEEYSSQGAIFHILFNKNLDSEHNGQKINFVIWTNTEEADADESDMYFWDDVGFQYFDKENPSNGTDEEDIEAHIRDNFMGAGESEEKAEELSEEVLKRFRRLALDAYNELGDNTDEYPPEPEIDEPEIDEEALKRIKDEYNNRFKYSSVDYEIDNYEDGVGAYFGNDGGIYLKRDQLVNRGKDLDFGYRSEFAREFKKVIDKILYNENVYVEDINFDESMDDIVIRFYYQLDALSGASEEAESAFEDYASEVESQDEEMPKVEKKIHQYLQEKGHMKVPSHISVFKTIEKYFDEEAENLYVDIDEDDESLMIILDDVVINFSPIEARTLKAAYIGPRVENIFPGLSRELWKRFSSKNTKQMGLFDDEERVNIPLTFFKQIISERKIELRKIDTETGQIIFDIFFEISKIRFDDFKSYYNLSEKEMINIIYEFVTFFDIIHDDLGEIMAGILRRPRK